MDILDEGLEDHLQFFGAESFLRIETCYLIEYTNTGQQADPTLKRKI
jgi:hypothetical protein